MQLFIQAEHLHCVDVKENDLLVTLKEVVQSREGININEQALNYRGQALSDGVSLKEAGIPNLSTINVMAQVLGGKVHGSLARAGKVKGQTPKVDKQEKKKKKTGRAHRRMQYNRRFVNVAPTFGRRRGPNSNS